MKVIDIDPELLRRYAEASIHAGNEAWTHMEAEFVGNVDGLMETLVDKEPLAYTIVPQIFPDGSVKSPISSTFAGVRECYVFVRGRSDLLNVELVNEIRGGWYDFQVGVNTGRVRGQDKITNSVTIGVFPVSSGKGITGELVWVMTPRERLGTGPAPTTPALEGFDGRRQLLALHKQFLDGYRANDVEAIVATMNDGVQANIRDYVNDTGTLIGIESKEDYRAYLKAFFARFEVLKVDHLQRLSEDWYLFAETRMELRERSGQRREFGIHTAEFFVPAKDNRIIVQTGHGTDLP
ncbi:SnoaL-like domain-containing protein [Novosphingobium sp. CF614]|uniref:nuclear transport factor 2 family protein n=1 Tax=Novosphingobium sp. CF614 TaxID=1884364 RepID=UPI0008E8C384|nr:nuclear transport factor 2 family protein [Novosphingobium sp. CF614]SFF85329.1 SnoaL-like domain-containing protein [Novosphingobium sp. CF614]